jgi:uncharacterized integral membrane protein
MANRRKRASHATTSTKNQKSQPPKKEKVDIKEKMINWLVFNIFIAILPILLHIVIFFGNSQSLTFPDLFSHGELLLICVAVTADAMGELIFKGRTTGTRYGSAVGLCIMLCLLSLGWFAALGVGGAASNAGGFAIASIIIFTVSLGVSANCKILSEQEVVREVIRDIAR